MPTPDGHSSNLHQQTLFHYGSPAYGGRPIFPKHARRDSAHTIDTTKVPLPNAPSLRIYCAYGYNISTERAYHYLKYAREAKNANNDEANNEPLIRNLAVAQDQLR